MKKEKSTCDGNLRTSSKWSIPARSVTTAEAFGTTGLFVGANILLPDAIASAEAFGTSLLEVFLLPGGITSLEGVSEPTLVFEAVLQPSSIASAEVLPTPGVFLGSTVLLPSAIAGAEAFGTPQVNLVLIQSGIASAEAFGALMLGTFLDPSSVASAEAFGTQQINLRVHPTGLASLEAIPLPVVAQAAKLSVTSITSLEAFGLPVLLPIPSAGIDYARTVGIRYAVLFPLKVSTHMTRSYQVVVL